MKRAILGIMLFGLTLPALAEKTELELLKEKENSLCEMKGQLARSVMEARQGGASLSEMLVAMGDSTEMKQLVVMAWEYPIFTVEEVSSDLIKNFGEKAHVSCIKLLM